jgi:hypothetical protein
VTIVVQTNTIRADEDALVLEGRIAAAVLGLDETPPEPIALPADSLERYTGVYGGERNEPRIRVTAGDGALEIGPVDGGRSRRLLPLGEDTFFREGDPYPMDRYVFDVIDGRAEAYSAYYNGLHGAFYQRVR